ncbi:MAG: hypothetical protein IMF15_08580 [Proteobacteria bacterium]|nr:hypothetical protein [Pseudomonadota bacterium]
MRNRSVKKCLTTVALLATGLSTTSAFANWYANQSENYYKPQEYHNEKYGNFPPADIDEKLFSHLNTGDEVTASKPSAESAPAPAYSKPPPVNQAPNYATQNSRQQPYGNYNRGQNYAPATGQQQNQQQNQRYSRQNDYQNNRNTNFNGPWNNNQSSFSGPWDNNGSSFSMPFGNNNNRGNNRSGSGGPWNNNNTNFSGPWDNNGSSFSMPFGNNNNRGNNRSGFNPMGGGWGW